MRKHPLLALVTAVSTASIGILGAVAAGATTTSNKTISSVHRAHHHHKTHHPRTTRAARRRHHAQQLAAKLVKTAAIPLVVKHVAPPTHHAFVPLGGVWAELRACESGGDYQENTGNGYYGAYQFSLNTWHSLGGPGVPSAAPPAVQDALALKLQTRSGWGPWPHCSVELHLI